MPVGKSPTSGSETASVLGQQALVEHHRRVATPAAPSYTGPMLRHVGVVDDRNFDASHGHPRPNSSAFSVCETRRVSEQPTWESVYSFLVPAERKALLHADPATVFVTPHYANAPGVIVRLSRVDPDALRELLVEAWRAVAPKRLVKAYDQSAM